jgi:hypothetical protein
MTRRPGIQKHSTTALSGFSAAVSSLRVDVLEISANEYPGLETVRPRNTKRPRK